MSSRDQPRISSAGSSQSRSTGDDISDDSPLPQNNLISPASATTEPETQNNPMDVNIATHIVVEHDRSGTVKTHVFSSKDGKPSLLGHVIPNFENSVVSTSLEEKMQTLSTLIQDSIEVTKKESLEKFDALRTSLGENESRVASQVSLATTCIIENQIKTELVPKLDRIESLLLGHDKIKAESKGTRSSSLSVEEDSQSIMGSSELTNENEGMKGQSECQSSMEALGSSENLSLGEPLLLERLSAIESHVSALCKVVIDGQAPPLTLGGEGEHGNVVVDADAIDLDAMERLRAMRTEMLTFPESLKDVHSTMQELIEVLASRTVPNEESNSNIQRMDDEQKKWQANMLQVMNVQADGLGNLCSDFQSLENGFKNMGTEFHDWRKTHKLSLQVYLRYMYLIFKRTDSVDSRINKAIEEIKEETKNQPQQWTQFSSDLDSLRSDVFAVLNCLPDMIVSQLRQSNETLETDQDRQSNLADQTENSQSEPQPDEPTAELRSVGSQELGRRALGVPRSRLAAEIVSSGDDTSTTGGVGSCGAPDTNAESNQDSQGLSTVLNSDPVIEKLVQTVEALRASVASMMEKYSGSAPLIPPVPVLSDTTDGDPDRDFAASVAEGAGSKTELSSAEASPPFANETNLERRVRAMEERFTQSQAPAANAAGAETTPASSETKDAAPVPEIASTAVPPASGYIQQLSVSDVTGDTPAESTEAIGSKTTDGSVLPAELTQELESMNKTLTQLVDTVKGTTGGLAQGQNQLNENMQSGIQRVIAAIDALESENQDNVEETIALQGNQSADRGTQNIHFDQPSLIGEVMKEITDAKAFTAGLENKLIACHNDVKNVLQGSMQDSSVIGAIKGHLDTMISDTGCATNVFLKAQVAEVIKISTHVHALVEDVKKISNKALTHQEEIAKKVDELQKKHDESMEGLGKRHDDGWQVWNEKNVLDVANIEEWHDKHDTDLGDIDAWRHMHHEELQRWHKNHDSALESWHKAHGDQLSELEKRHCHCCSPDLELDSSPRVVTETETEDEADPTEQTSRESVSRSADPEKNYTGAAIQTELPGAEIDIKSISCCGGSIGHRTKSTSYSPKRVREIFEELLKETTPNYDRRCLQCGHLTSLESIRSSSTSGIIVQEPHSSAQSLEATDVPDVEDSSQRRTTLGFKSRNHINPYVQDESDSLSSLSLGIEDSMGPTPRGMGESSTYHGGLPASELQSVAGQNRYGLRGPYFPTGGANTALGFMQSHSSAQGLNTTESTVLEGVQKELSNLQERYTALTLQFREKEDATDRYVAELIGKGQQIVTMVSERERIELEFENRVLAMDQEITRLKEKLVSRKQKLKDANSTIENLYRERLGLSTSVSEENLKQGNFEAGSDIESVHIAKTPHYSLMADAAEQFQQTLEEFKLQKAHLHHDIDVLEARKLVLLEEVSAIEESCTPNCGDKSSMDLGLLGTEQDGEGGIDVEKHKEDILDGDEEPVDGDEQLMRRAGRSTTRTGFLASIQASSMVHQQTPSSQIGGRGPLTGISKSIRNSQRVDKVAGKVPQLEADIKICKDGNASETLLSSTTLLTEDQLDRIRSKNDVKGEDDEIWSLTCDFRVRMVHST
ncbi:hypothetical protein BGX27_006242 [Mortierella sp. AM989]|nr:hypothetical protein BGX27_006242 [Mortierella sp. AM989]